MALDLFANFERASNNATFYRVVTSTPYTYPISYRIDDLTDVTYNTISADLSAVYSLNNGPFQTFTNLSTSVSATIGRVPSVSSFQVRLSTTGVSAQYIGQYVLCASFVPYMLSASNFVAYPEYYFVNYAAREEIFPATAFAKSPGLSFYGEGHTEVIKLCALSAANVTRYVWKFEDFTSTYTHRVSNTVSTGPWLSTAAVAITSELGFYPKIPIQLQATNSIFPSSSPEYYFDDVTGAQITYPYFVSTVDAFGNESLSNTKYRESINIKPYDNVRFLFNPGSGGLIYLPINGSIVPYTANLRLGLALGRESLSACFQKYGIVWKWATFDRCTDAELSTVNGTSWFVYCSAVSANKTFVNFPSSWANTQCLVSAGELSSISTMVTAGLFSKTWAYQSPELSADKYNKNPIFSSGGPVIWNLSSVNWIAPTTTLTGTLTSGFATLEEFTYPYELELSGYGFDLFTTSYYENIPLLLTVQRPLTSLIDIAPYDWKPKTSVVSATHLFVSVAPPEFLIYTPNRYVLTGIPVKFQNLTERLNLLSAVTVDYGDGSLPVTYNNVYTNFTHIYSSTGVKNVKFIGNTIYDNTPVEYTFPDLVYIVSQYDDVQPENYRSFETPLILPYPDKIQIAPNDLAVADVYNSCVEKFYKNLEYIENRGYIYTGTFTDYFGWFGPQPIIIPGVLSACTQFTWEDLNCEINPDAVITWVDASATDIYKGSFSECGTWINLACGSSIVSPDCFGLYNVNWRWADRKLTTTEIPITWSQTKLNGVYKKRWFFEPSQVAQITVCNEGVWNVNIPKLNTYYNPIGNCRVQTQCQYKGVAAVNNVLYTAQKTQVKILSSDYTATFLNYENLFDDVTSFRDIKNICVDSENKVFVLDSILSQVSIYTITNNVWELFLSFGGAGTSTSRNKFYLPNDIHLDQYNNIWVTDTGNNCIKQYSNTGTWLQTIIDDRLKEFPPLSLCIDSQNNIHVLTDAKILVYTYNGQYLFEYLYSDFVTGAAVRINTSYNREIIYLCTKTQVVKFFRNGIFAGNIITSQDCVEDITSIYQDEFRNLLITTDDKILKYVDLMTLKPLKGALPSYYWNLEDLYIHPEEYIQNWVYNKSLQRLWDNIELIRSTILYTNVGSACYQYKPPIYQKSEILIGQNEIVTSAVINRALQYLWENFSTLIDPFDPRCPERG
jgi:hypothetical protein